MSKQANQKVPNWDERVDAISTSFDVKSKFEIDESGK